jgi:4-hydroxyproline epimerase
VHGDIAWGGNWFFICEDHGQQLDFDNIEQLNKTSVEIRRQLDANQVFGRACQCIDHVELIGPSLNRDRSDAKNFVLCPGAVYDRSPCGTGTSAKLACLAADVKLAPGAVYRQESIVGSVFEASYKTLESTEPSLPACILPTIVGSAFITGEAELLLDSNDPFCWGLLAR